MRQKILEMKLSRETTTSNLSLEGQFQARQLSDLLSHLDKEELLEAAMYYAVHSMSYQEQTAHLVSEMAKGDNTSMTKSGGGDARGQGRSRKEKENPQNQQNQTNN